ncbi:MAG: hypothetical protein EA368_17540 [Leptolyngbya sp. DLM2.Bin27]|nr:MAG: hypothetical protein EA368_17540 [Leptolyngbya sp. DLM2.Bin27]
MIVQTVTLTAVTIKVKCSDDRALVERWSAMGLVGDQLVYSFMEPVLEQPDILAYITTLPPIDFDRIKTRLRSAHFA